jgi:hypothetical protein
MPPLFVADGHLHIHAQMADFGGGQIVAANTGHKTTPFLPPEAESKEQTKTTKVGNGRAFRPHG